MSKNILYKIREKVRTRQYVMTIHAEEEMDDDRLSIFDIEHCLLTGEIIETQKDKKTGEKKYLIKGESFKGDETIVVNKLSITGTLVIITVFVN